MILPFQECCWHIVEPAMTRNAEKFTWGLIDAWSFWDAMRGCSSLKLFSACQKWLCNHVFCSSDILPHSLQITTVLLFCITSDLQMRGDTSGAELLQLLLQKMREVIPSVSIPSGIECKKFAVSNVESGWYNLSTSKLRWGGEWVLHTQCCVISWVSLPVAFENAGDNSICRDCLVVCLNFLADFLSSTTITTTEDSGQWWPRLCYSWWRWWS